MSKNYTIINSVPKNSGDLALLESVLFYLYRLNKNNRITVYSDDPDFLDLSDLQISSNKKDVHFLPLSSALEKLLLYVNKLLPFSIASFLLTSELFFRRHKRSYFNNIKQSDKVISSPGGYLHDFYNNKDRFYVLNQIANKNLLVLLGQSIGPFWKAKSKEKMLKILLASEHMIFRESISEMRYEKYPNLKKSRCPDIGFLLHKKYNFFKAKSESNTIQNIAVSFRYWKDEKTTSQIIQKATKLCNYLIEKKNKSISFLSTCQGLENYTDDLKIGKKILNGINNKNNFVLVKGYHTPKELIQLYRDYDSYIGMRMHGAILSMIAGTPAINIGYEDKSLGLFKDLGLEKYCVKYTSDLESWQEVIQYTENNYSSYTKSIKSILDKSNKDILHTLDNVFL